MANVRLAQVDRYWGFLAGKEQDELRKDIPHTEWLRVALAVLDQVVQDLGCAIPKAIHDRVE